MTKKGKIHGRENSMLPRLANYPNKENIHVNCNFNFQYANGFRS